MAATRRHFITTLAKGIGGISIVGLAPLSALAASQTGKGVRIQAIPGRDYPTGFLRFIEKARFDTPAEAVASVRDRRLAYKLVWQ